jgi:YD repeat-containing protein
MGFALWARAATAGRQVRSVGLQAAAAALVLGLANPVLATPPTAPTNLAATAVSSTQVSLTWTASTDTGATITGYNVQRCAGSTCTTYATIATVTSGTAYVDAGLTAATTYRYRVDATDSLNNTSGWSSVVNSTTFAASIAGSITYGYDALGRLVQAIVPALSQVENYTYDSSGNITSATSTATATLGFGNVSNPQGASGSSITIFGSGFSTTPSSDTVKFNGTAATVTSATTTQLIVTVPAGATTGAITVKVGSNTVTSPGSFTVVAAAGAPTVTGFLPTVGAPGSSVVITGTNFPTTLSNNKVLINQTWATVVAATATSLTVVVPAATSGGPITVTTPTGSVTTAASFGIPEATFTAATTVNAGAITVGGAAVPLNVTNGNAASELFFSGAQGANLTIAVSAKTLASGALSVYAPNGTMIVTRIPLPANGQAVEIPTLPANGSYTILLNPNGNTGSVSLSLVGTLSAGTLTLNGAGVPVTLADSGQAASLTFIGTQNTLVTLNLTNVTLTAGTVSILNPNGSVLLSSAFGTAGASLLPQLAVTGTYSVVVVPTGSIGGSFTAALVGTPSATLTANTGVYNLVLTNQTPVTLTFNATATGYVSLAASESNGGVFSASFKILMPDQTQLTTSTINFCSGTCGNGSGVVSVGPLPETGTYSAVVQQTGSSGTGTWGLRSRLR